MTVLCSSTDGVMPVAQLDSSVILMDVWQTALQVRSSLTVSAQATPALVVYPVPSSLVLLAFLVRHLVQPASD